MIFPKILDIFNFSNKLVLMAYLKQIFKIVVKKMQLFGYMAAQKHYTQTEFHF